MGRSDSMEPTECLRLLGLSEAASAGEIKRAYRRLARRFHPDKTGGDPRAREHFVAISKAYRSLLKRARLIGEGRRIGACSTCREFAEVVVGLDGRVRCPACALRPGERPLLPLPPLVVVKCASVIFMLAAGVYLLGMTLRTGDIRYALGGVGAGLGALGLLAFICLRVLYCIQPNEEHARRTARRKSRRSSR